MKYFTDEERNALLDVMPYVVSSLDERHFRVLVAIYYEGATLRPLAKEMGVSDRTIRRWRDQALAELREIFRGSANG